MIEVIALSWLGIRTDRLAATKEMFASMLGLSTFAETPSFVAMRAKNGDVIELFDENAPGHEHFDTGPVAGFEVADLALACKQATEVGLELIGPIRSGSHGTSWQHFRGVDGNVYELLSNAEVPA